jgi:penicillin-binding protein 2
MVSASPGRRSFTNKAITVFPHPAGRSPRRLAGLRLVAVAIAVILLARLWTLQVVGARGVDDRAAAVGLRVVEVPSSRGLILDARGRVLVADSSRFTVTADRAALNRLTTERRATLFDDLGWLLHADPADLRLRTVPCTSAEARAAGLRGPRCFDGTSAEPAVLDTADADGAVLIAETPERFPGIDVVDRSVRSYPRPAGASAGAVLGYVSRATQDDLDAAARAGSPALGRDALVGHAGLESQYDRQLRGVPGQQTVSVDRLGTPLGVASERPAQPGLNLVTNIDAGIQARVEQELARSLEQRRRAVDPVTKRRFVADSGTAVVMDVRTGAVVALASSPGYDPGVFVDGLTTAEAQTVLGEQSGAPMIDRAVSAQYAPGSTFKPMSTAGAMNAGISFDATYPCPAALRIGGTTFGNFESDAHGSLDFAHAISLSCNTFFYRVAYDLWKRDGGSSPSAAHEYIANAAKDFGLGSPTGVDLPSEAAGRVPDRTWRLDRWQQRKAVECRRARTAPTRTERQLAKDFCVAGGVERAGDAVLTAIGQGDVLATPLQLAVAYAAIANGGTRWQPQVADRFTDAKGVTVQDVAPKATGRVKATKAQLADLRRALRLTARSGTSSSKFAGLAVDLLGIGAKTGTAEVAGKQTTALLVTTNPDYVVLMLMTQSGTGGSACGDAVRSIWESLYGVRDGSPHVQNALAPKSKVAAMVERASR